MDAGPILTMLVARGCRFVVVGSTARHLLGECVEPADLDVVVADSVDNRRAVMEAMIELKAKLVDGRGTRRIVATSWLPWEWSWRVLTVHGPVDVIVRFIDGTGHDDHDTDACDVILDDGSPVRCHATRRAA